MMVFARFSQWFQRVEHSPFHNGQNSLLCDFFVCVYDLLGFLVFLCVQFSFSFLLFTFKRNGMYFIAIFKMVIQRKKNGF